MAKAIEPIPELRGKAASWFEDFLRRGEKQSAERAEQAKRDAAIVSRMRPLPPSEKSQ